MADVTTTVIIDLNVRVGPDGQETVSGYEDVRGPIPALDEYVFVLEQEDGVRGGGWVTRLDPERRLIYLQVDWRRLTT